MPKHFESLSSPPPFSLFSLVRGAPLHVHTTTRNPPSSQRHPSCQTTRSTALKRFPQSSFSLIDQTEQTGIRHHSIVNARDGVSGGGEGGGGGWGRLPHGSGTSGSRRRRTAAAVRYSGRTMRGLGPPSCEAAAEAEGPCHHCRRRRRGRRMQGGRPGGVCACRVAGGARGTGRGTDVRAGETRAEDKGGASVPQCGTWMLAADLPRPLAPQAQVSVALHASGDGEEQPPVGGGGGGGGGAHSVVLARRCEADAVHLEGCGRVGARGHTRAGHHAAHGAGLLGGGERCGGGGGGEGGGWRRRRGGLCPRCVCGGAA